MNRLKRLLTSGDPAESWRGLSARTRWFVLACVVIAIGLFVSQLVEIPKRSAMRGSDNTFNYLWLRSLMVGGDLDFRDDLDACNTLVPELKTTIPQLPLTKTGVVTNKYGVGWSLVSVPFYLAADGIVGTGRALGVWNLERDGYNWVYQVCLQTGHFLLAGFALFLAYRVTRRWCAREPAVLGVAMLWAASPMLYYQTSNLSMSHGVTFFALVLCLYALQRTEAAPERWLWWMLAGAGLGLATITRYQTAVFGLVPVWAILMQVRTTKNLPAMSRQGLAFAAGAVPFVALQMVAWKIVYGSWLLYSYGAEAEPFYWTKPVFAEVLFSAKHGLFYWHPLLLAGCAGLIAVAWKRGGLLWAGVVVTAISVYVNAAWWCWWFGSSFGSRAFEGAFLFFMVGLAWCFERLSERATRWLFAAGASLVVWNLLWLLLYRMALVSRNDAVTYGDVVRAWWKLIT
ncbi:ArnT family glycosyltransferase [Rariglobus hedericola]|nr:glycosyltransferase family 39 protein [Rariglobus hedericola]